MEDAWDRASPLFEEELSVHTNGKCWEGPQRPLALRLLRKASGGFEHHRDSKPADGSAADPTSSYHGPLAVELCDALCPERLLRAEITATSFQEMSASQRIRVPFSQFSGHLVRLLRLVSACASAEPRRAQSVDGKGASTANGSTSSIPTSDAVRGAFQLSLSSPDPDAGVTRAADDQPRASTSDPWSAAWGSSSSWTNATTALDGELQSTRRAVQPAPATPAQLHPGAPCSAAPPAGPSAPAPAAVLELQESLDFALVRHLAIPLVAVGPGEASLALASQLRLCQQRLADSKAQLQEEREQGALARDGAGRSEAALEEARRQHAAVLADERARHREELAASRREAQEAGQRAEAAARGDLGPQVAQARADATEARAAQAAAQSRLEEALGETQRLAAELASSRGEAQSLRERAGAAEEQAHAERDQSSRLLQELNDARQQSAGLSAQVRALEGQAKDARELADSAERARIAEAAARAATAETATALRAAATQLQDKVRRAAGEVERGNEYVRRLQAELRQERAGRKAAAEELAGVRGQLQQESVRARRAEDETATARRAAEEAEREAEGAQAMARRAQSRLQEGKVLLRRQEQAMAALHARVTGLRAAQLGAAPPRPFESRLGWMPAVKPAGDPVGGDGEGEWKHVGDMHGVGAIPGAKLDRGATVSGEEEAKAATRGCATAVLGHQKESPQVKSTGPDSPVVMTVHSRQPGQHRLLQPMR